MGDNETLALLRRNPVLATGDGDVLSKLARRSRVMVIDSGGVVVRADAPQSEVLMIAEGGLELSRRNRAEGTQVLFGTLTAPSVFGDVEWNAGMPWLVTARAAGDTLLVGMPIKAYEEAVSTDLALARGMYRDASCRHFLIMQIMLVLALQRTPQKILALLWEHAEPGPHGPTVRVSPVALGKALGIDRKTVRRNLAELEVRGLILRAHGSQVLLKARPQGLEDGFGSRGFGTAWKMSSRKRK